MISKFFLKKTGFFRSKQTNHATDENNSASSEKEDETKEQSKDELSSKRSSSKFYVETDGDLPEPLLSNASGSLLDAVSSEIPGLCCSDGKNELSGDVGNMDLNSNNFGKPELRPKPKIPSPLPSVRMANPTVFCCTSGPRSARTPSPPIKLQACPRTSFFPPPWPPSPYQKLFNVGIQENHEEGKSEKSPEVSQMRTVTREAVIRNPGSTAPGVNRGSRGSRRSFTTDDADIGLYRKPAFCPELSPLPDPFKPKRVVLRRGKGSDVGSRVDLFESLTSSRPGSFAKDKPVPSQNPAQESQNVAAKPKPPIKPRISNCIQDLKPVSTSKSLTSISSNETSTLTSVTEENVSESDAVPASVSAVAAKEKPQLPPNKPERKPAASEKLPSPTLPKPADVLIADDRDSDGGDLMNSFSDDDWSDFESGEESNGGSFKTHSDKAEEGSEPVDKAQKVAEELLKTEEAYVGRLELLDKVFQMKIMDQNREEHFIPDDVIPQIFSSIKSILLFHNDFLLPQLRLCMAVWGSCTPRIGQVLKKFAPFLKLYTDYVKNFENATNLITLWLQRSPRFAACLEELQRRPECGCLTLQHHLLEPIQRVPRYELLLRDYIKHLPEDSEDRSDASEALELVTRAAQHSNMEMRKIEKFRKLLDIKESLGGALDLVNPTREFIKDGKITKISARDGDHSERHLFLFNDLLVVCQSLPLKQLGLRQQYIVKAELDIRGMQVLEGNNLETAHTFVIKSKQKSIEFCGGCQEGKEEWQRALWSAISEYTKKEHSRNADPNLLLEFQEKELGKRAPMWVKDQETTMCMNCGERFTAFKRRHHCRCCGKVLCNKCSAYKAKLSYSKSHELRVCVNCSAALGLQQAKVTVEKGAVNKARAVLKTRATDPSVLNGYLNMSSNRKTWNRKFFAIHSNFVLYSFKAHQDVIAHTSLPLPGYEISNVEKSEDVQMKDFVFCVSQKQLGKFYYFQADDESQRKRWIEVLLCAINAEFPSNMIPTSLPDIVPNSNGVSLAPSSDDADSSAAAPPESTTCDDGQIEQNGEENSSD